MKWQAPPGGNYATHITEDEKKMANEPRRNRGWAQFGHVVGLTLVVLGLTLVVLAAMLVVSLLVAGIAGVWQWIA